MCPYQDPETEANHIIHISALYVRMSTFKKKALYMDTLQNNT